MAKMKLGERLRRLFGAFSLDEEFFEDLEDLLMESDLGARVTMEISEELQETCRKQKISDKEEVISLLRELLAQDIQTFHPEIPSEGLTIFLFLGVNGVGKTTTLAKMARYGEKAGWGPALMAAGDTFRAAAIEQLQIQGERTGCRVVSQSLGSDPGAVIFDGIASARARDEKVVLADTAGRMHNKSNLVRELEKIDRVVKKQLTPADRYYRFLIIDATTGQNGLRQAEIFHEALGLDGIVLTKYDSSARGGIVPAVCRNLGIPFSFIGRGEGLDDLLPFDRDSYLDDLLEGISGC